MKKLFLNCISLLYKSISFIILMARGIRKKAFNDIFVISVDNLSFGGTGKTPAVLEIGEVLNSVGIKYAVILRGYGGQLSGDSCLVSDRHKFNDVGDEAVVYKKRLSTADIFVGKRRVTSIKKAIGRGNHVVILDDGFQSRNIKKDLKIMLINPNHPYYFLRNFKFLKNLEDAVFYYKEKNQKDEYSGRLGKKRVEGRYFFEREGFFDKEGNEIDPGNDGVIAFSAVGDNSRFKNDLSDLNLSRFVSFRDHYTPSKSELLEIENLRKSCSCKYVICTEKDYIKLDLDFKDSYPFIYMKNRIKSFPDIGKLVLAKIDE